MLCNSSLSAHGFPTFGIHQHPLCRETSWTRPRASCLGLWESHFSSPGDAENSSLGGDGTRFSVFKMRFQGRRHTPAVVFTCVYRFYDSRADATFQVLASSPQSCLWLEREHISSTHFVFLFSSLYSNIFLKYIWHFSPLEEFCLL